MLMVGTAWWTVDGQQAVGIVVIMMMAYASKKSKSRHHQNKKMIVISLESSTSRHVLGNFDSILSTVIYIEDECDTEYEGDRRMMSTYPP
jgi:hypothetical protein